MFVAAAERRVLWTPTLCLFDKFAHDGEARYIEDYDPAGTVSTTVLESLKAPGAWWHEPDGGVPTPPWARWVQAAGRAHALGVRWRWARTPATLRSSMAWPCTANSSFWCVPG